MKDLMENYYQLGMKKSQKDNFETTWSQVEYDISNIAMVAFIQNKYTKEILQVSGKN